MKTKKLLLAMMCLGLGCALPLQAEILYNIEIGGLKYYFDTEKKEAWLQDEGTSSGWVEIPESVEYEGETYKVTAILGGFWSSSEVTAVQIPKTVRYIAETAFKENRGNLKEVHITDLAAWCSVENKGFPQAHTQNLFLNGNEITELVIPDGVEDLGSGTFYGLPHITSIILPDGLKSIGELAFSDCMGLTGHLDIPQSVTQIGSAAFSSMINLESINLPDGLTEIAQALFFTCRNLQQVNIPEHVTAIGTQAFYGCKGLKEIVIPDGVREIGKKAFYGCNSLEDLVIGKRVKSIKNEAFLSCYGLKSISLPESLEVIEDLSLACANVTSIYCHARNVPVCKGNPFGRIYDNVTLYVPRGVIDDYKKDAVWGKFRNIEALGVEENPQGIETVQSVDSIVHSGIYDLQGRKLEKAPQKGIFIQDGKKIVK